MPHYQKTENRTKSRLILADFQGNYKYAQYSFFSVGNSETNFTLNIAGYTGTAGDSLDYHNGMQFSTKDRDNDQRNGSNCASSSQGAWWYKSCTYSNLNGQYRSGLDGWKGMDWYHFLNKHTSAYSYRVNRFRKPQTLKNSKHVYSFETQNGILHLMNFELLQPMIY